MSEPEKAPGRYTISRAIATILEHWRLVAVSALVAMVVAGMFWIFSSDMYHARAVLYINETNALQGGSGAGSAGNMLSSSLGGASSNAQMIGLVLRSRSLADSVRAEVGSSRAQIEETGDGAFIVEGIADNPATAAAIANSYAEELNELLLQFNVETNMRRQDLLRRQIETAAERLEAAERSLADFERQQGAPEITAQLEATVAGAANLERQVIAKETEVHLLSRTATPDNPRLTIALAELQALRDQLQRFKSGRAGSLFPSLTESPEIKVRVAALLRELTEAEQIYLTLTGALAATQIAASQQLSVVNTLDAAVQPTVPAEDNLLVSLLLASIAGAAIGAIIALFRDALPVLRMDPAYAEVFKAWDRFRADVLTTLVPRRLRRSNRLTHQESST